MTSMPNSHEKLDNRMDQVGIVYLDFNSSLDLINAMTRDEIIDYLGSDNSRVSSADDLRPHIQSAIMPFFENQSFSKDIIRLGRSTLFDRDHRAVRVFDRYLERLEKHTGGYAFDHDPQWVTSMISVSKHLAAKVHDMPTVESLWEFCAALSQRYPRPFNEYAASMAGELLEDALEENEIKNQGTDTLRYLPRNPYECKHGFVSIAEYEHEVMTTSMVRSGMKRDIENELAEKSRERISSRPVTTHAEFAVAMAQSHPISQGNMAAYHEFIQSEIDSGYSPYGYWFSPDGTVYPIQSYQDHDRWLGNFLGRKTAGLREDVLAEGWVSLTMANEFNSDPNIGYNPASDCSKALKAAARVVRRGGDYAAMMVEAYDENLMTLSFERFDDLKQGIRRLNELSREVGLNHVSNVASAKP